MQESSDGSCQTHWRFYSMMIPYPLFHDTMSFPVYNIHLHLLSPRRIQDNPDSTKLQTAAQGSFKTLPQNQNQTWIQKQFCGIRVPCSIHLQPVSRVWVWDLLLCALWKCFLPAWTEAQRSGWRWGGGQGP